MGLLPSLDDPNAAKGYLLGIKIVIVFWLLVFIGIAGCMLFSR